MRGEIRIALVHRVKELHELLIRGLEPDALLHDDASLHLPIGNLDPEILSDSIIRADALGHLNSTTGDI